jgi:hypothetical protein
VTDFDEELRASHEALREAIRNCALATNRRHAEQHRLDENFEAAEFFDEQVTFVNEAVLLDYVIGSFFGKLDDGSDYHSILATDGLCSKHRSAGLSALTTRFLMEN